MTEQRFKRGDRVDFNNGWAFGTEEPNNTPGTIRRVIITRKYVVAWDDGADFDDPLYAHELIAVKEEQ